MKLLRKKAFAISAMAITIIAGIMYGSYFSISRAHHGAEQAFYRGEYYSIQDDLNRRMEYAQDMVYIAKQYNKQQADTHQQADVEPTQAAIDRLRHAKTLSEKYDADLDLENAMTDLYISLQGTNLKDSNERDAKSLYESFQLYKDNYLIEEYNNGAVAFNNQLEEFPTNLFNAIYHFDKVELYQ